MLKESMLDTKTDCAIRSICNMLLLSLAHCPNTKHCQQMIIRAAVIHLDPYEHVMLSQKEAIIGSCAAAAAAVHLCLVPAQVPVPAPDPGAQAADPWVGRGAPVGHEVVGH